MVRVSFPAGERGGGAHYGNGMVGCRHCLSVVKIASAKSMSLEEILSISYIIIGLAFDIVTKEISAQISAAEILQTKKFHHAVQFSPCKIKMSEDFLSYKRFLKKCANFFYIF